MFYGWKKQCEDPDFLNLIAFDSDIRYNTDKNVAKMIERSRFKNDESTYGWYRFGKKWIW